MTIIVTGCAGFIGLNFTKYHLQNFPGDRLVGIDSLSYAANVDDIKRLSENEKNFVFYRADICNRDAVFSIFEKEKPDCVINFAAETHVDRSIECATPFVMSNVVGAGVLLDACLSFGGIRFHQISTDEVYGDLPLDSKKSFYETSILNPSSPYSASKAAADLLTLSYLKTHSLPVTISRCSNNFGFYQNEEKMIPHSVLSLINGEKIKIYGDGTNVRDWIYVLDHVKAIEAIIERGRIGEIYNVGAGVEISNITLVKEILSAYYEREITDEEFERKIDEITDN